MFKRNNGLAIVNRGFWPQSQVIGEALLQLAEKISASHPVYVITQSQDGKLDKTLHKAQRGSGVKVMDCRARSNSSTGLIKRSLDALIFMVWTFISLVRCRPAKVYVATNPPVVVPFVVMTYCRLFRARYYYHLQDIHPEAAHVVVRLNPLLSGLLTGMDNMTMRYAESLITLSEDMRAYIRQRSGTQAEVALVDNPAFPVEEGDGLKRDSDVVFCGNAGRLQRIPLLLEAISDYIGQGGRARFTFAGAGVFAPQIAALADEFDSVAYHGFVSAKEAANLTNRHRWALLPLEDNVARYAFPSKSSSYVLSGCQILAVCGRETSVARWVEENGVGLAVTPDKDSLVKAFFSIENDQGSLLKSNVEYEALKERLQFGFFTASLCKVMDYRIVVEK